MPTDQHGHETYEGWGWPPEREDHQRSLDWIERGDAHEGGKAWVGSDYVLRDGRLVLDGHEPGTGRDEEDPTARAVAAARAATRAAATVEEIPADARADESSDDHCDC